MPDPKRTPYLPTPLPTPLPTLPGGQSRLYDPNRDPRLYQTGRYPARAGYQPTAYEIAQLYANRPPAGLNVTQAPAGQGSVVPPNAQVPNGELYYPNTVANGGGQLPPSGLSVGGGAPPKQPPALSPLEAGMRAKIDAALGQGFYDDYKARTGQSPVDRYRNPRMLFWDEPNTPEGAANSFVRDELMNAQNAQRWQELHGDTPIPQEQWERWYYANRQGMRPDDVNQDGNRVVY